MGATLVQLYFFLILWENGHFSLDQDISRDRSWGIKWGVKNASAHVLVPFIIKSKKQTFCASTYSAQWQPSPRTTWLISTRIPGFPDAPLPLVVSSLKLQKFASAGVESLLELLRVHERANYLGNRAENVGKLEFFIARLFIVKSIHDYMCLSSDIPLHNNTLCCDEYVCGLI